MAEATHPRAAIWTGARANTDIKMEDIEDAKRLLQTQLQGTGLFLVGLPVIEEADGQRGLRLSWKVYSGQYPIEENNRG